MAGPDVRRLHDSTPTPAVIFRRWSGSLSLCRAPAARATAVGLAAGGSAGAAGAHSTPPLPTGLQDGAHGRRGRRDKAIIDLIPRDRHPALGAGEHRLRPDQRVQAIGRCPADRSPVKMSPADAGAGLALFAHHDARVHAS